MNSIGLKLFGNQPKVNILSLNITDSGKLCVCARACVRKREEYERLNSVAVNRLISHRRLLVRKYSPNWISLHEGMKIEIWIEVANACLRSRIRAEICYCFLIFHVLVRFFSPVGSRLFKEHLADGFVRANKWSWYIKKIVFEDSGAF